MDSPNALLRKENQETNHEFPLRIVVQKSKDTNHGFPLQIAA